MKKLNRVLITNWHYFSHEVFSLSDINFLTGKNASGKTTLIDAMQVIILGDTSGHFFNKSAQDKGSRSLKGYLKCEIGDNDDGSIQYLRNGRFSSYVALEFHDDENDSYFTVGCVFDVFDDGSYDNHFFSIDDKIPENEFVVNNVPLTYKDLRVNLLENNYACEFFETNTQYREFIKARFGGLNNNFFSLFKKAIPFSPIANIEQFITEYVCDVKSTIDVIKMQESIRNYKSLEIETNNLVKRVDSLEAIIAKYKEWKDTNDSILVSKYLFKRADIALRKSEITKLESDIQEMRDDVEDNNGILESCKEQIKSLNKQKDDLNEEKFNSDAYKRQKDYLKQKDELESKIESLNKGIDRVKNDIKEYINDFKEAINEIDLENIDELKNNTAIVLKTLEEFDESYIKESNLLDIQSKIAKLEEDYKNKDFELRHAYNLNDKKIEEINEELNILSRGEKPYAPALIEFKEDLKAYLSEKHDCDANVSILADEIDITDESYRNAIEAFLNTNRFYIIVEDRFIDEAIRYYRDNRNNYQYNIGIVDTAKVMEANFKEESNSISTLITSNNKFAKAFINSLVGNLSICEDINKLRDHKRSLMKDGMLYQNFVARSLSFQNLKHFIGSASSISQIASKEKEKADIENQNYAISNQIEELRKLTSIENLTVNEIKGIANTLTNKNDIEMLTNELNRVNDLISSTSNNYIETLNKKITEITDLLAELDDEKNNLLKEITLANNNISNIESNVLPSKKATYELALKTVNEEFEKDFVIQKGEPAYMEANGEYHSPKAIYDHYFSSVNNKVNEVDKIFKQVTELRIKYNYAYKCIVDPYITNNDYYENEYNELALVRLKEYKEKIKEAKENALSEFRNDFLSKLRENFDTVKSQIDSLNEALEHAEFGNDKYLFVVSPKKDFKDYYDMINDPMLLLNQDISNKQFYEKYEEIIEDLFRQITYVDESLSYDIRQELEKNIAKFTDYRSYLKFDLIVTDTLTGNKQHLSRTLLKKSGGETQTPFYISILASFAQAYHIYLNGNNNAIRLIIFDEAFSKMDAERIMQSVKLLRNFGLQAIISAPPEKMGDIVPLVDKTLCVIRNNSISSINEFTNKDI